MNRRICFMQIYAGVTEARSEKVLERSEFQEKERGNIMCQEILQLQNEMMKAKF